jgi:hypothetical protein
VALLAPASPYYLPALLAARPQYQGQPLSHWLGRLEQGSSDDRQQAIYAVGVIGMPAEEAVPVLARIMVEDEEGRLRNEAAFALSKMAPACKTALPELSRALRDEIPMVRMNAARALFCLAGEGRPAIPVLIECLNDPDNQTRLGIFPFTVQHQIALALGRVSSGTPEAVPALREALEAADTDEVRATMIRALGEVGRAAEPAAEEVRRFAGARDPELRFTVAEALERIEGRQPPQDLAPPEAPKQAPKAALPDDEQAYLWDIEHHGNVLVKHGLTALAKAIQDGDEAALKRCLSQGFRGADVQAPRRVAVAAGDYQVERVQAGQPAPPDRDAFDRDAFAARLLAWRDVYASAQRGLDVAGLHDNWKSESFNPTPGGVYVADFNRDGILDLLITDARPFSLSRPDRQPLRGRDG